MGGTPWRPPAPGTDDCDLLSPAPRLVCRLSADQVSLQFGKTGEHMYTMDFSYPLSPLQAFQIVLSSFAHKLACE